MSGYRDYALGCARPITQQDLGFFGRWSTGVVTPYAEFGHAAIDTYSADCTGGSCSFVSHLSGVRTPPALASAPSSRRGESA